MNKKKIKYQLSPFEYGLILAVITVISMWINIVLGGIVGVFSLTSYRRFAKNILPQEKNSPEAPVYVETKKLIDTLVSEQVSVEEKPVSSFSYPIQKGSLPAHIHNVLDEMGITTWGQLALYDEKELLYQKCFGEEALKKIKAELAKRGLTLNNLKNRENDQ